MLPLHLRINDAATKQPTPVRLRVTGSHGEYYAPLGRLAVFSAGKGEAVGGNVRIHKENWAYIDGSCEIALPSGVPLRVQATKGPLYTPMDETVTLGVGKMALRFEIAKTLECDWASIDSRVHFVDPFTAHLEAAAEDVGITNLLAASQLYLGQDGNTYESLANIAAFSGQQPALDRDGHSVIVNTLNTHPVLGRLSLLNSHRPVYPLAFGGNHGPDDWSLIDWCRQCHRKKGLTVWVDAFRQECGLPGGEALVAAILGEIDAIEIDSKPRKEALLPWIYRLWNAGFLIPIVGGSGKDSNAVALGAMRTIANVNAETNWVEALRNGLCFVSTGPLLTWNTVNSGGSVQVTALARSVHAFDRLEIIADGVVIASDSPREKSAVLEVEHRFESSGWLAARVIGADGTFAHTSPVPIVVEGMQQPRPQSALSPLRQAIEQTREWAVERGHYTQEKWRTQLLANCDAALAKLTDGDVTFSESPA